MCSVKRVQVKGLIRRNEAISGACFCGVPASNVHFLDLPFYQTGTVKKNPITEVDVKLVAELLEQIKPNQAIRILNSRVIFLQIYAAGDLSDPHGTHRMCLKAVLKALDGLKESDWFKECQVWLYRGAWQEWEPERIEMAVPMSPKESFHKRLAIFKHQSQKDVPPFPGSDKREFWQRAEVRNKETASLFDKLGLTEYEAIETFVSYNPTSPDSVAMFS